MTNLSEFSAYYMRAIWRTGDTDLEADLPRLIKEAEARISRDLRDASIVNSAVLTTNSPVAVPYVDLPADFKELLSINFNTHHATRVIPYPELAHLRSNSGNIFRSGGTLYYAIFGGKLHMLDGIMPRSLSLVPMSDEYVLVYEASLAGEEPPEYVETEFDVATIQYYSGIPPLTEATTSSFYDLHPDFFISAVNVQVYNYLRDFDLSGEYNGKYVALLDNMRRQSNYLMFPSGQLSTPLSAQVR